MKVLRSNFQQFLVILMVFLTSTSDAGILKRGEASHFCDVLKEVQELIQKRHFRPEDILLASDWDQVISSAGPRDPDLSQSEVSAIIREINRLNIPFTVVTARGYQHFLDDLSSISLPIFEDFERIMVSDLGISPEQWGAITQPKTEGFRMNIPPDLRHPQFGPLAVRTGGILFSYYKATALSTLIDRRVFKNKPKAIIFVDDNLVHLNEFEQIFSKRRETVVLLQYKFVKDRPCFASTTWPRVEETSFKPIVYSESSDCIDCLDHSESMHTSDSIESLGSIGCSESSDSVDSLESSTNSKRSSDSSGSMDEVFLYPSS